MTVMASIIAETYYIHEMFAIQCPCSFREEDLMRKVRKTDELKVDEYPNLQPSHMSSLIQ